MFYQIIISQQVKGYAIITFILDIYELPNQLPKDLRLKILRNWEIPENCLNFI